MSRTVGTADRLAAALHAGEAATLVTGPDGRVEHVSAAAAALLGHPETALLGTPLDGVLDGLAPVLDGEGAGDRAGLLPREDGGVIAVRARTATLAGPGGTVTTLHDLDAEQAATGRAEAVAAMVEAASEAIVGTDADDVVWFVNPAAEQLLGRRASEVVGQSVWRLVADHPRLQEQSLRDVRRGRPARRTTALRHPDGHRMAVVLEIRPLLDAGARYRGAVVTALDVSARREAEREADRARGLLQRVIDQSPNAVWAKDRAGRCRLVNRRAAALLGRPPEEILGRTDAEPGSPGTAARSRDEDAAVLASGVAMTVTREIASADAGRRTLVITKFAILDPEGKPEGVAGVAADVTELRAAELALREHADRLERSNAELEAFAFTASHDLQEPLRLVSLGTGAVLGSAAERLEAEEQRLLREVVDAAGRASSQVDALMELARVVLLDDAPSATSVRTALDDALGALGVAIAETGARVEVVEPLGSVAVPRAELALVLQNLLANAVRFRRPGVPPRIVVTATRDADEVRLRVRDNGTGLTEADQRGLFAVLARAHEEVPGTGLGLALCRRLLERRDGTIAVSSAGPGRGSCFELRLPATSADGP